MVLHATIFPPYFLLCLLAQIVDYLRKKYPSFTAIFFWKKTMTLKIDNAHYLDDTLCMTVVPLNVCIGIQYDSPVVLGEGEFNRYHLYSWVDWHVLHSCLVVLQRGFSLFCDNISKELSLRQTLWYLVDFISFKEIANHLVKKFHFLNGGIQFGAYLVDCDCTSFPEISSTLWWLAT